MKLKSEAYLDFIRAQPCCNCGKPFGVGAYHINSGGVEAFENDVFTIPLCHQCFVQFHWNPGMVDQHFRCLTMVDRALKTGVLRVNEVDV